jgi:cold-inducible RNA-binding protein
MTTKLFVAGLPFSMADNDLSNLFIDYGTVVSARIVTDRDTNRSKGFGFVEMSTADEAKNAIQGLNEKDMNGRPLTVNEARPREERPTHSSQGRPDTTGNNYRSSRR